MWKVRDDEPRYAFLQDPSSRTVNVWDAPVDLIARSNGIAKIGRDMLINEETSACDNPNRNQQHAFHFTADNCIGCHACEAACSEKNDNPAHISFRSVGYVEGGSYPDFTRMNISMACNHCDDPVCLKGCPTGAYTKHAEYGAVLQDPDTCFGCGYCTWVCPYNAPQLDPVKGQVSKCNMCVDRLEVGLKPACVSACLGNALNFGVVENIPEHREQAKLQIPGFPDPSITRPNIRFQQSKNMPDEVTRTDGMPLKYHKGEDGNYRPVVDQKKGRSKQWGFSKLNSRENPLVLFTLLVQAALGAFITAIAAVALGNPLMAALYGTPGWLLLTAACTACGGCGLLLSMSHLGKPMRFYRGFNNLRWSPMAREGLGVALFTVASGIHFLASAALLWLAESAVILQATATLSAGVAVGCGSVGLYYMVKCYLIRARPFWNHWQTATSFVGNSLSLGGIVLALCTIPFAMMAGQSLSPLIQIASVMIAAGLGMEVIGLIVHARAMNHASHEGAASHYIQQTSFGKTYLARNIVLGMNVLLATSLAATTIFFQIDAGSLLSGLGLLALSCLACALVSRALFYVLVVPTTMPGAFFWKNKDFEQHAIDIGLAAMPQVGVMAPRH